MLDHGITQGANLRYPIVMAHVLAQDRSRGICGGQSDIAAAYPQCWAVV
jgi:hypothetical protein